MHIAMAVDHVMAIALLAVLVGENVAHIGGTAYHHVGEFEILKYVGHHLCDAVAESALKARQIKHERFAIEGILQNLVETLALIVLHSVERAENHYIVLIDSRPHHIKSVNWICAVAHLLLRAVGIAKNGGERRGAIGITVD